jgi:outer membrane autotransporter protein
VFQESTRTVPQVDVQVEGDADGEVTWFSANGGFDVIRGAWTFGPYLGLTHTSSKVDDYTERDLSASGLNMRFSSTTRDSLLGHAGLRVSYAGSTRAGVVLPQLRLEYQSEFEDDAQQVAAQFALDPAANEYLISGDSGDKNSLNAGFSLAIIRPNGWMAFFDYSILLGNDGLDRSRATLGLRVEF